MSLECSICFEPFAFTETIPCITSCSHVYCERCCTVMFMSGGKNSCPFCRVKVSGFDYDPKTLKDVYESQLEIEGSSQTDACCSSCVQSLNCFANGFICVSCNVAHLEECVRDVRSIKKILLCHDCLGVNHSSCLVESSVPFFCRNNDLVFGRIIIASIPESHRCLHGIVTIILLLCLLSKSDMNFSSKSLLFTLKIFWKRFVDVSDKSSLSFYFYNEFQVLLSRVLGILKFDIESLKEFVNYLYSMLKAFESQNIDDGFMGTIYRHLFSSVLEKTFLKVQVLDEIRFSHGRLLIIRKLIQLFSPFKADAHAKQGLCKVLKAEIQLLQFYLREHHGSSEAMQYENFIRRQIIEYCMNENPNVATSNSRELKRLCDGIFEVLNVKI